MSSSPELRSVEMPRRRDAGRNKETPRASASPHTERRPKSSRDHTKPLSISDVYRDTKTSELPVVSYQELPALLSNPNLEDLKKIARLTPDMIKTLTTDIAQTKELSTPRRKQIMDELYILAENTRARYETLQAHQAQVDKYTKGLGGKIRGFFFRGAKEAALGEERVGVQALAGWEAVFKVMYLLQIGLNRAKHAPLPPKNTPQATADERQTIGEVATIERSIETPQSPKKVVPATDDWSEDNTKTWDDAPKSKQESVSPEPNLTNPTDIKYLQRVDWSKEEKTAEYPPTPPATIETARRTVRERRASTPRGPIRPAETTTPHRPELRPAQPSHDAQEVTKLLRWVRGMTIWNFEIIALHQDFVAKLKTELDGVGDPDTKIFLLAHAARQELARHKKLQNSKQDPLYIRSLERLTNADQIPQKNAS